MRKGGSFKIKFTVITGYLLVMIIMILGLYGVYRNLVVFTNQKIQSEDHAELLLVGNTLSKLYEIESDQNLFTAESARQYFHTYDSIAPEINNYLDTLKLTTRDDARAAKLDTIKHLIQEKKKNLQLVALLLDSITETPLLTQQTESSYIPRSLNREVADFLEKNNLQTPRRNETDTSVVVGKRKGLIDRVRNVFVAAPDSTLVIKNKSVVNERQFSVIVDTLINKIRYSEKLDLTKQRQFQIALLSRLETMSITNRMLTSRIDDLLKSIEQEEIRKSIQLIVDKEKALTDSQRTMFIVSCLAVLIALLVGMLFLADINRSQRYRRQLEISHNQISKLLASREKLMLTISHDIKAPMSSILGYIDLMDGNEIEPRSDSWLRNMKNSGEHVLQLVSMLLDHHQLESGAWQLNKSNFHLQALVAETVDSFKPLALQKGLTYTVENNLPSDLESYGDPYVIRQVMGNLISNAIKYTAAGAIYIVARMDEDHRFTFSVTDTGEGIEDANQQYIFQEFSRLNVYGGEEGSGLGLAITKGFVDALEGTISLVSEKEKGSEFVVELPLSAAHEKEPTGEILDLEGISVLVVDDDPVQLAIIGEMLQKKKIQSVVEVNPRRVMKHLQEKAFDIVFIDIRMPQINGITLVEKVRSFNDKEGIPMIALSAGSDFSISQMQAAGFSDFLSKPLTSERLYSMIHHYVKQSKPDISDLSYPVRTPYKGVVALIEFVRDDKQASLGIIQSFISETTINIDQLQSASTTKDHETIGEIAHKMLPLFQMMGNDMVITLLRKLTDDRPWSAKREAVLLKKLKECVEEAQALQKVIEEE